MEKIKWKAELRPLASLKEWEKNPRKLTDREKRELSEQLEKYGNLSPIVIDTDGTICGGHGRRKVFEDWKLKEALCWIPDRKLTADEFRDINVLLNTHKGQFDSSKLVSLFEKDFDRLKYLGVDGSILSQMKSDFEETLDKMTTEGAAYPIMPKMSERYDAFVIFTTNEIERAFMMNFLKIGDSKSYKNKYIGICRAVAFEKFKKELDGKR